MRNANLTLPVQPAPKHTSRQVVWDKDGKKGHAILLVGYCPTTLPYYLGLVEEVLRTFPDADLQKTIFGQVTQSRTVKGHTLLIAPIKGPKREVANYEQAASIDFN